MVGRSMEDPPPFRNTGIKRLLLATKFSGQGLMAALKNEAAFRQEVAIGLPLVGLALWLEPGFVGRALLIGSVMVVWMVELLNTGIEAAIDYQSTKLHPMAKLAKDLGSAAVFISLLNLSVIWGLYLWDKFS